MDIFGRSLTSPFAPILGTTKDSTKGFYCTATEWNNLCGRVNEFRAYKGIGSASFTAAEPGNQPTKAQFDQVRAAIFAMNASVPASPAAGSNILASQFNGLMNSLNSIT